MNDFELWEAYCRWKKKTEELEAECRARGLFDKPIVQWGATTNPTMPIVHINGEAWRINSAKCEIIPIDHPEDRIKVSSGQIVQLVNWSKEGAKVTYRAGRLYVS